jgi:protein O-GlcNAc transferase
MKTPTQTSFANEYRRALGHHQAGEFAKAEALYIKLLRVQSTNSEIQNQLGVLYCQRGQLATGLQHLIRATKLERTPCYLHNPALAYRELKEFDRSIATLNAILDLEPENSQVRYDLAIVLQMSGRFEEALVAYRALLEMKPDFLEDISDWPTCCAPALGWRTRCKSAPTRFGAARIALTR